MMNSQTTDYNYCITVGQTDVGRVRKQNEDHGAHFVTQNGLVSVVCDGMGGHVGGAIASEVAIQAIRDFLSSQYFEDPREAIGLAIDAANNAIIQRAIREPELKNMGSTCVLLIVRDAKVYIGHVGDSRIYLIRERNIIQLTKDHSFVQMLVDQGVISKEQAEHHPRKNEITNALGIPNMSPATVKPEPITPQAGDCFLLCSDGLSGMVSDAQIEKIVSRQRELRTQERADLLVQTANNYGGVDNITVELVEFTVNPTGPIPSKQKKYVLWGTCVLGVLGVLALCAVVLGVSERKVSKPEQKYIVWGSMQFEKGLNIFSIQTDSVTNLTFVQGNGQRDTIQGTLKSKDQIETNLESSHTGSTYTLRLGETISVLMDSAYVQLTFENRVFRYRVNLERPESGVAETPPTYLSPISYKKGDPNPVAVVNYFPQVGLISISVANDAPQDLNGVLEEDSISVKNAELKKNVDNGVINWRIFCTNSKGEIRVSFVAQDKSGIRRRYTYIIPIDTQSSDRKQSGGNISFPRLQDAQKQNSIEPKIPEEVPEPKIQEQELQMPEPQPIDSPKIQDTDIEPINNLSEPESGDVMVKR